MGLLEFMKNTTGPWHHGHRLSFELDGQYITLVGPKDLIESIAQYWGVEVKAQGGGVVGTLHG